MALFFIISSKNVVIYVIVWKYTFLIFFFSFTSQYGIKTFQVCSIGYGMIVPLMTRTLKRPRMRTHWWYNNQDHLLWVLSYTCWEVWLQTPKESSGYLLIYNWKTKTILVIKVKNIPSFIPSMRIKESNFLNIIQWLPSWCTFDNNIISRKFIRWKTWFTRN